MAVTQQLRVAAAKDQIRTACDFVAAAAHAAGLSDKAIYHCEIAVEEACVNIIEYGYQRQLGTIDVTTEETSDSFTIIISDSSPPFNPLDYQNVDLNDEDNKMEPGGLGIHFFTNLMDELGYTYSDGQNHLILRKFI